MNVSKPIYDDSNGHDDDACTSTFIMIIMVISPKLSSYFVSITCSYVSCEYKSYFVHTTQ